ncbi:transcriptional regulator PAI 2-type [Aspergillus recurvatus]
MFFASAHTESDEEVLLQFIQENPLGMLITGIDSSTQDFLQCTHPPTARPIAKQNPQARALIELTDGALPGIFPLDRDVLVVFNGRHGHYVTPRFTPRLGPTPAKLCPTWNYSAVQVYGKLLLYHDPKTPEAGAFLTKQMDDLSEQCERRIMGLTGDDRPQPGRLQMRRSVISN